MDRRIELKTFDALLEVAAEQGVAAEAGGRVRHPQAAVAAVETEEHAVAALRSLLESQGLAPGTPAELAEKTGIDRGVVAKALTRLASEGAVVRLAGDLNFSRGALDGAREALTAYLRQHGPATAAQLRDVLGVSRKYAIPLLEYFDAQGLTKREGDERVLRG